MCCFSPVAAPIGMLARLAGLFSSPSIEVRGTRIFARLEGDVQHLVYSMSLSTPADVAMVLPLPVAPGRDDDALSFVDLSGYARFFDDVRDLVMPAVAAPQAKGGISRSAYVRPRLVVHSVGSFEASFVPSISDFDRLDPRFRLPDDVWAAHPEYRERGFGFAVFKLKKGQQQSIHPMAMSFSTSEPDALFFPTLHVHDGHVHEHADFDHELYFQHEKAGKLTRERPDATSQPLLRSTGLAESGLSIDLTKGLVAPDLHVHGWMLGGQLANTDTRLRAA